MVASVKSVTSNSVGEEEAAPATSVEIELSALNFSLNNLEAAFSQLSYTINPFMVPATATAGEGCKAQDSDTVAQAVATINQFRNRIEYLRSEINDHIARLGVKF